MKFVRRFCAASADQIGMNIGWAYTLAALGVAIPVILFLGLALPATREATIWFAFHEHHPVEILTPIPMFLAAIVCCVLTFKLWGQENGRFPALFYFVFGLGIAVVGMDEIAWGQKIFHWETPDWVASWNQQGETTLHNVQGLQGNTEFLRMAFGFGGMIGIRLVAVRRFEKIGAPLVLLPWFFSIAVLAVLDLIEDYHTQLRLEDIHYLMRRFSITIKYISESVEMMVGISAFLYAWLNHRRIALAVAEASARR
jgi:hypothetical protein